jgi:hypothetical protein
VGARVLFAGPNKIQEKHDYENAPLLVALCFDKPAYVAPAVW